VDCGSGAYRQRHWLGMSPAFPQLRVSRLLATQSDPERRNEILRHHPHPRRGVSHCCSTWRKANRTARYDYFADTDNRYALYNLAMIRANLGTW
jgi:hypothetical protein